MITSFTFPCMQAKLWQIFLKQLTANVYSIIAPCKPSARKNFGNKPLQYIMHGACRNPFTVRRYQKGTAGSLRSMHPYVMLP